MGCSFSCPCVTPAMVLNRREQWSRVVFTHSNVLKSKEDLGMYLAGGGNYTNSNIRISIVIHVLFVLVLIELEHQPS